MSFGPKSLLFLTPIILGLASCGVGDAVEGVIEDVKNINQGLEFEGLNQNDLVEVSIRGANTEPALIDPWDRWLLDSDFLILAIKNTSEEDLYIRQWFYDGDVIELVGDYEGLEIESGEQVEVYIQILVAQFFEHSNTTVIRFNTEIYSDSDHFALVLVSSAEEDVEAEVEGARIPER